ncbi:MAG: hypothetical protein A3F33_02005 [Candidatus Woykebacteria bacterium RIFCSPHIGHO2_12_FULL_43_10]|uniref:UPF0102 protein A3A61_03925 n=2 Tax=Candidatus Woykeibacteriota TaxID=1817899 RepID=A0A1G1WYR6_9BACT|nr:MAG: hypothetical protein A3F33_02005 [Candidatus Woykebacteria bacterium RIFCSPHIGHO2_12_FULL_43_10]OGY29465.1 MAG: hypothetical protein A3J50_00670 [Candidatus Woykebacteria bacterium RIFCSPHIGHO2_02_FULL_43_16b]OGY32869.1 MAG: hypothetical protein A3A61_03925 [Candidatus Woykebacteria bacterium RIFCSPLOWO2_01_FULL_43_14]
MTNQTVGSFGEKLAVEYLIKEGYQILEKNWRCPAGEIDIIGLDQGALCFVEVKTRTNTNYGLPEEIITKLKLSRMARCIDYYNARTKNKHELYRIDILAIELEGTKVKRLELIKNATLQ